MGEGELHPLARLSFAAHDLADPLELLRHALVGGDDFIERVGDLAQETDLAARQANREVTHTHRLQRVQKIVKLRGCAAVDIGRFRGRGAWRRTIGLEFADRLFVRLHGFLPARMNRHDVTSAATPSRRYDAVVILGRVSRKAADGKRRSERYASASAVRAGPASASRPAPELSGAGGP